MKTLVVYYSLSGTTRTLAHAVARELRSDIEEIRCDRYRPGVLGALKAAYDSWRGRLPAISELEHAAAAYDLVLVGAPMWAMGAATPARAYLRRESGKFRKVAFFLTFGGAAADKALREMETLAGRAPIATLAVRDKDVKAGLLVPALASFCAALRAPQAAWA
jgi:hypothetical protein